MATSTTPTQERYDPTTYRGRPPKGPTTWVFSSNIPHRAPLICYVCGIEVPIVSASTSGGVSTIPQCRIGLFPDPRLQRIGAEDRLPVVLFYLDEYIDPEKPTWRMFFEGEVVGWSYMNSAMGRTVGLDCVMDIAAWTQLFIYYMSTVQGLAEGLVDQGRDGSTIIQAVVELPYALFHRGLMPEATSGAKVSPEEYITRPYDFPYNVIRNLISTMKPDKLRCMPAVNFFTRWCRRQNFHNKWVALPFLDDIYDTMGLVPILKAKQDPGIFPLFRAVKADFALKALENQALQEYSGASIYQMLKKMLDIVFMEVVMLATPPYVKTNLNGEIVGPGPVYLGQQLLGVAAAQATASQAQGLPAAYSTPYSPSAREPGRLGNYFVKPQCYFALPPVCNVIFPSMTPQISYTESYITQPTRLYIEDPALAAAVTGEENPQRLLVNVLARGYPPAIDRRYQERLQNIHYTGKNILLYPEEFFKGPVTSIAQVPSWFMYYQQYLSAGGGNATGSDTSFSATPSDKSPLEPGQTGLTEGDLYKLYAQYEYFRQRYEKRQGAVVCAFDPYIVPGFPLMVFDEVVTSQFHLIGYLMNYSHDVTSESIQTSLNFSYGRTVYEWLTDIANEIDHPQNANNAGQATASAPPEPLPEVRDILQHEWHADQFYAQLFNRATEESLKGTRPTPAVCRIRDLLRIVNPDGTLSPLKIEGKNANQLRKEREGLANAKTALTKLKSNDALLEKFSNAWRDSSWMGTAGLEQLGEQNDNPALQETYTALAVAFKVAGLGGYGGVSSAVTDFLRWADNGFLGANEQLPLLLSTLDAALKQPPVTKHNLTDIANRELVPAPGSEPYFDSYDAAMKYCSRPICTLEEYISFIGGVREGPIDDVAYKDQGGSVVPSARYYARIRYLKGATAADDAKVTDAQQGIAPLSVSLPPDQTGPPAPTTTADVVGEAVPLDFPVMRAPWDQILLAHRAAIHSSLKVSR